MSCGVACRRSSDPVLLWLWQRPATIALIRPLAWEPPYAVGVAIKRQKDPPPKKKPLKNVKIILSSLQYKNGPQPNYLLGYSLPTPGPNDP